VSAVEALDIASTPVGQAVSPQALAQGLYERHSKRILGFCVRRLPNREEAEDAVQTTFLYALRALQRGVVPVSETAWLFKIAENVCLAAHRTNGRRRERELAESPEELIDHSSDRDNGRDTARKLVTALGTLTPKQRQALLLREWRGLSYREISGQLGVSVAAVETLIFRARKGVARALNGETSIGRRIAGLFDLGAILNTLKAAFGGGATAAKIAAAAAVVTVAALPAGDSVSTPAARTLQPSPAVAPSSTQRPVANLVAKPVGQNAAAARRPGKNARSRTATGTAGVKPARPTAAGTAPASSGGSTQTVGGVVPPSIPSVPEVHVNVPPAEVLPVSLPAPPSVRLPAVPELPSIPSTPVLPVQIPAPPVDLPQLPQLPHLP
jgi:RNA polymerase sigma-70 factor, ECF subfamily